jgi:hypothetical protein
VTRLIRHSGIGHSSLIRHSGFGLRVSAQRLLSCQHEPVPEVSVVVRPLDPRALAQVQHLRLRERLRHARPAVAELVPSTDPKLPHGLIVKGIKPTLKLSWKLDDEGKPVEEIDYEGK